MEEYSRIEFAKQFGETENQIPLEVLCNDFARWLIELNLPESLIADLEEIYLPVCSYLMSTDIFSNKKTTIIGVTGSQGSGKTTFVDLLARVLKETAKVKVVTCSIDDFYLTRAERESLSREVHPLLITRGVPGTHDVQLGIDAFRSLTDAHENTISSIPVFDKANDDRKPKEEWIQYLGRPDFILFEGWCVGANAVDDKDLEMPVNDLEYQHDRDGTFRKYSNQVLKSEYAEWFGMIEQLFILQVPGFEQVTEWRWLQEKKLAEKQTELSNKRIMNKEETRFFISHFERITRQMLKGMPLTADIVFKINQSHVIENIKIN